MNAPRSLPAKALIQDLINSRMENVILLVVVNELAPEEKGELALPGGGNVQPSHLQVKG